MSCVEGAYNLGLTPQQFTKPDVALLSSMGVTSASYQVLAPASNGVYWLID